MLLNKNVLSPYSVIVMLLGISKTEMNKAQSQICKTYDLVGDTSGLKSIVQHEEIISVYGRYNNGTEDRQTNFGRQQEFFYKNI